jgi:N6-L-threonylcarbamoyladenine synthase
LTLILGIETSCDETAAAVVEDGRRIRSSRVASQVDVHRAYGGVVPEVASRHHLERLDPVVGEALAEAGVDLADLDAVAVTRGPGLVGALMVGVSYAKALAFAAGRPVIGVNHVLAHVYGAFLAAEVDPVYPALALVVSGGHTDLLLLSGVEDVAVLGVSRDDAAGEAFDKVARAIGLGYPGGPAIERRAAAGDPEAVPLPEVRAFPGTLDFSFSGLKTAALRAYEAGADVADLAAAFQARVVAILARRTAEALERVAAKCVVLAGGVAANRSLVEAVAAIARARGLPLFVPPPALCTDNAAMVAALGHHRHRAGLWDGWDLGAEPVIHPFKP